MGYYLAIEIGEDIGRHMLGYLEKDKLLLEEIYRFEKKDLNSQGEEGSKNEMVGGWELKALFEELKAGIRKCREIGKLPIFIGIDTWRADMILLNRENKIITTMEMKEQKEANITSLVTMLDNHPEYRDEITSFLLFPDYFNYLLTGVKLCEYTTANITGMIDKDTQTWEEAALGRMDFSHEIYPEVRRPGAVLGNLTRTVTEEVGYDCIIVLPATHAPSSAYFALPMVDPNDQDHTSKALTLLQSVENEGEYTASAIGNLLVHLIISHELKDVLEAQECVKNSFRIS